MSPRQLGTNPRALRDKGTSRLAELAKLLNVSEETVRGYLDAERREYVAKSGTQICEECGRQMWDDPCAFCAGKCGARTARGTACQVKREQCANAKHSVYREYTYAEREEYRSKAASYHAPYERLRYSK